MLARIYINRYFFSLNTYFKPYGGYETIFPIYILIRNFLQNLSVVANVELGSFRDRAGMKKKSGETS